jgi:hypothetical protein
MTFRSSPVRLGPIPDHIPDQREFPSERRHAVRVVRVPDPRACVGARTCAHRRLPAQVRSRAYVRVPDLCHVEERKP